MPRANLLGQPYAGKSIIANAQQSINLYAESNKNSEAPTPITYYPFPGTAIFATPNLLAKARCIYRTSIGTCYCIIGSSVYFLASNGVLVLIGAIADRQSQVYMADNGLAAVLVDGSTNGYAIDLTTNDFGLIIDPSFYGADFALFLDTFFIFNRPGTNQFYISLGMVDYALLTAGTSFDPLDIAAKSGSADPIVAIYTTHKELGLVGELTTEVWIGTGAADFFFQQVQGAYIDHGCIAQYSVASQDVLTFWIMQDKQGKNIVVKAQSYDIEEISTPYLLDQFNSYETTSDAIGMCFQIGDHAFYLLVFPTENITWAYELSTGYWLQVGKWNTVTGQFDRFRANCCAFAFGQNLIGDYLTGKIYKLMPNLCTDDGDNMKFIRTFLHMVGNNFERVVYKNCSADIEPGTSEQVSEDDPDPEILLSWSDNRGKTFGTPLAQSLGRQGEYLTDAQWNRLGQARDRVFKLEWNGPTRTALNGAFVEAVPSRT